MTAKKDRSWLPAYGAAYRSLCEPARLGSSSRPFFYFPQSDIMRQPGTKDCAMTFEEMVVYLQETYPADRYRGDELMDYITAEIKAAEARGAITPDVREKVYRHFGVTTSEHGGPG